MVLSVGNAMTLEMDSKNDCMGIIQGYNNTGVVSLQKIIVRNWKWLFNDQGEDTRLCVKIGKPAGILAVAVRLA